MMQKVNDHIYHLEELITFPTSKNSIGDILDDTLKIFQSKPTNAKFSVKWDGSPAIICGTCPKTRKFFLATKSLFNKTPIYFYSKKDIRTYYFSGPGLSRNKPLENILLDIFNPLKNLKIPGILHGDLLFTNNMTSVPLISTKNNVVRYFFEGIKAKVGIVFHTTYSGDSLENLVMIPGADVSNLPKTDEVWYKSADECDLTDCRPGFCEYFALKYKIHTIRKLLNDLEIDSNFPVVAFRQYVNSTIRNGSFNLDYDKFVEFMNLKFHNIAVPEKEIVEEMFRITNVISECKDMFLDLFKRMKHDDVRPSIHGETEHEGFVVYSNDKIVKFVRRELFSYSNFNIDRKRK